MKTVAHQLMVTALMCLSAWGQTARTSDGNSISLTGIRRVKTFVFLGQTISAKTEGHEIAVVRLRVKWSRTQKDSFEDFGKAVLVDVENNEYKAGVNFYVSKRDPIASFEIPFSVPKTARLKRLKWNDLMLELRSSGVPKGNRKGASP